MERLFENAVKTALIIKLFIWALVTLFGALLLALLSLFGKPNNPHLNNNLASEDPYGSSEGNAENGRALRYL